MSSSIKILILICGIFYMSEYLYAQTVTWNRVYGGSQQEYGKYGIQTFDGGYIILAEMDSLFRRTFLLKLDQYGNKEWEKFIDSSGGGFRCIQQTNDSGYIIAGWTGKARLIRTNKTGIQIWSKEYSINNEFSFFNKVKILSDGNFIMCGNNSSPRRAYFVKTDSSGNLIWQNSYSNSTYFTDAFDVAESSDNFYYITGLTYINGYAKTLIGKISNSGDQIWFNSHGSEEKGDAELGKVIFVESDNLISVGGSLRDFYNFKGHFSKYDTSGNFIYQRLYESMDEFHSMSKSKSGYSMCGDDAQGSKINFIKITNEGIEVNNIVFNSNLNSLDYGNSINTTLDGGFIITGNTGMEKNKDILVIKTDSIGYAPLQIFNFTSNFPETFKLYQNFPNPFNSSTTIKFDVYKSTNVKLFIYNSLGQVVSRLIDKYLLFGSYSVNFNIEFLGSGVFYYTIFTKNYSDTKVMIHLK
ncbi:MAG: T9SS type A sorting domain-containing protein [Ignavibacteria bacterium]|nr:T9SS type A sorting domain-containing protein [Ignavibacteria bacterium]